LRTDSCIEKIVGGAAQSVDCSSPAPIGLVVDATKIYWMRGNVLASSAK
jgi:hypothetical protein